jgi:hypothetical protein
MLIISGPQIASASNVLDHSFIHRRAALRRTLPSTTPASLDTSARDDISLEGRKFCEILEGWIADHAMIRKLRDDVPHICRLPSYRSQDRVWM